MTQPQHTIILEWIKNNFESLREKQLLLFSFSTCAWDELFNKEQEVSEAAYNLFLKSMLNHVQPIANPKSSWLFHGAITVGKNTDLWIGVKQVSIQGKGVCYKVKVLTLTEYFLF